MSPSIKNNDIMNRIIMDLMTEYTENYTLTGECKNEIQWQGLINGQYWVIRINVTVIY